MNLFEIKFVVVKTTSPLNTPMHTRIKTYQVPAENQFNAIVRIGQIYFHEDYEIDVISITKVK